MAENINSERILRLRRVAEPQIVGNIREQTGRDFVSNLFREKNQFFFTNSDFSFI